MPTLIQVLVPIGIVLLLCLLMLLLVRIHTVVHELGHAVAMLSLCNGEVSMYLGSYGKREQSWCWKLGRLEILMLKNPLKWRGGMCHATQGDVSVNRQILYILAGPFASLLLSLLLFWGFCIVRGEGPLAPVLLLFCIYTALSFLANIVPRDSAFFSRQGALSNDGKVVANLLAQRRMPPLFFETMAQYRNNDYAAAAVGFETLLSSGCRRRDLYRMAIEVLIRSKAYSRAQVLQKEYIEKYGDLNGVDKMYVGLLKICLGRHEEAIGYLKNLVLLDGRNPWNLNNLGYALSCIGKHEEAIGYLNQAIAMDGQFAHSYGNRGFALIETGKLEEGLVDVELGYKLDPEPAFYYRNIGAYHYRKGAYEEAVKALEQAQSYEEDVWGLDALLAEARSQTRESSIISSVK